MKRHQNNKKQEEKNFLIHFSHTYHDFPKGRIKDSESPDFIVSLSPKRKLGIELTRLTQPNQEESELAILKPHLSKEYLIEKIKSKEEKIPLYQKKKLNELWLILVADALEKSTSFNINNQIEAWNIESRFDKVFLFEVIKNKVYEMQ